MKMKAGQGGCERNVRQLIHMDRMDGFVPGLARSARHSLRPAPAFASQAKSEPDTSRPVTCQSRPSPLAVLLTGTRSKPVDRTG